MNQNHFLGFLVGAATLCLCVFTLMQMKTDNQTALSPQGLSAFNPEQPTMLECKNHVDPNGVNLGGYASGPGIKIQWQGEAMPDAASPLNVLKLTAQRMSHLQQTPQANDQQAKALFAVLEAIDMLDGSHEVSAPVDPEFVQPEGDD